MIKYILLIIIGFIMLIKGADLLVEGSSSIAKKLHIPKIIIGLTIVSIGTSLPELFVSLNSAKNLLSDITLGNVIGSNLCNLFLILGLSACFKDIRFKKETVLVDLPISLTLSLIFMLICNINNDISKIDGIILLLIFILFIIYTVIMGFKDTLEKDLKDTNKNSIIKNIIYIVIGIILLKYGGNITVNNSQNLALSIGISEKIISLTIIAIGTSLPELMTSILAAKRKESDIAIGNILGSNIFNMFLITGLSSIIYPITYNPSFNIELLFLFLGLVLLFIFNYIKPKYNMTRIKGLIFVLLYIFYMSRLFVLN